MTVGIWQAPLPNDEPQHADVVIVGAGIIGSYLAMRLRETHDDVMVLEARHVAGGASGRNGGLLLTGVAHSYVAAVEMYGRDITRQLWSITVHNREAMIGWATRLGTPVRRCGSYILSSNERQAEELRESAVLMRENGFPVDWYDHDPLDRGFGPGLGNSDDGAIQPAQLTAAMIKASGARLRETSEVYALESRDDGVLLRARGGDVLAQRVVLAANAWMPQFVPELADVIVPTRNQVIATAPGPRVLDRSVYCDDGYEYFQQLPDGRFVLGGYRNLALTDEHTYADATTPLIQSALEAFLHRHFPELAAVPIERRWSGTMGFTPDGLPMIGRLRRDERIAFICSCNGHGLGLGMVVADELLRVLDGSADGGIFAARRLMATAI